MRAQPAHHNQDISVAEAEAQLTMLLVNARDEKFAGFTVDGLAAIYRVRRPRIAELLARERGRRHDRA